MYIHIDINLFIYKIYNNQHKTNRAVHSRLKILVFLFIYIYIYKLAKIDLKKAKSHPMMQLP